MRAYLSILPEAVCAAVFVAGMAVVFALLSGA